MSAPASFLLVVVAVACTVWVDRALSRGRRWPLVLVPVVLAFDAAALVLLVSALGRMVR